MATGRFPGAPDAYVALILATVTLSSVIVCLSIEGHLHHILSFTMTIEIAVSGNFPRDAHLAAAGIDQ